MMISKKVKQVFVNILIGVVTTIFVAVFYTQLWPMFKSLLSNIPIARNLVYPMILIAVMMILFFSFFYERRVLLHNDNSWRKQQIQVVLVIVNVLSLGIAVSVILTLILGA